MIRRDVSFEKEFVSADAIQRAAYRLSDRLSSELSTTGDTYRCALEIDVDSGDEADRTVAEFRNEVLDQVLRARIRTETEDVRNLILSLAFSRTGLTGED